MARPFYLIGNWKMNKTGQETSHYFTQFSEFLQQEGIVRGVGIAPVFTALYAAKDSNQGKAVWLGAQNMGLAESGAHTGEVAPGMLKEQGVEFVIIGHSERRQVYHETSSMVAKKVRLALAHDLTPIVCVGETDQEREAGKTMQVVCNELKAAFDEVDKEEYHKVVMAYEPLWAIGTGKVAHPDQVSFVHKECRDYLNKELEKGLGEKVSILYGGSVNKDNALELAAASDVDGFLVGGASLKFEDFVSLVNLTRERLS